VVRWCVLVRVGVRAVHEGVANLVTKNKSSLGKLLEGFFGARLIGLVRVCLECHLTVATAPSSRSVCVCAFESQCVCVRLSRSACGCSSDDEQATPDRQAVRQTNLGGWPTRCPTKSVSTRTSPVGRLRQSSHLTSASPLHGAGRWRIRMHSMTLLKRRKSLIRRVLLTLF
jgi:hypothetical protein